MFISNEKGAVKSDSVKQIIAGFEDKLDTDTLTKIIAAGIAIWLNTKSGKKWLASL